MPRKKTASKRKSVSDRDWAMIRKYKANIKKFGSIRTKGWKVQTLMLTAYTKAESDDLNDVIRKYANKIGGYAGDGWWDMITSIIVDGGKSKFNQALKVWEKPEDDTTEWDDLEKWANKQNREKKIYLYENYLYPLQYCQSLMYNDAQMEECFSNFSKFAKGKKIKDKSYQKAYEKWLADKESKKSKPKKKTTKRKAPAKKKTTKRKTPAKKKTTKRKSPAKKKTTPAKKKTTKRKTTKRKR